MTIKCRIKRPMYVCPSRQRASPGSTAYLLKSETPVTTGSPSGRDGQCIALAPHAEALGTADSRWVSLSIQWETKAGRPLVGGAWANLAGASHDLNSRLDDWTSRPSSAVHVHSPPTPAASKATEAFSVSQASIFAVEVWRFPGSPGKFGVHFQSFLSRDDIQRGFTQMPPGQSRDLFGFLQIIIMVYIYYIHILGQWIFFTTWYIYLGFLRFVFNLKRNSKSGVTL